jgi:hypothetical protein
LLLVCCWCVGRKRWKRCSSGCLDGARLVLRCCQHAGCVGGVVGSSGEGTES